MKTTFWQRLRLRYRISALNENTLSEVWHFHLSWVGIFFILFFLFLITFAILAVIIWFTPIKHYLPGYDENLREELVVQVGRVDSLTEQLSLQNTYLGVVRDVISGEVESDSIQPLDSLTVFQREELLAARSEIIDDFVARYEEKERDNLNLFDVSLSTAIVTMYRPVNGVILKPFNSSLAQYEVLIQSSAKENVRSVANGTVVMATWVDNANMIVVQHEADYLSIYKNVGKIDKRVGAVVKAGETLGFLTDECSLSFSLWHNGKPIDPTSVIVF